MTKRGNNLNCHEMARRRKMRIVWLMLRAGICGDGCFYAVGNNGSWQEEFFLGKISVESLFYKNENGKKI
jgi:hypothetical protein